MASSRRQYPFHLIEPKWQAQWETEQTFRAWNPGDELPAAHPFAARHKISGNHLGHSAAQHKANMQNLASALFEHELIKTTLAKAKALRKVAEPLITRAKTDSLANRRLVYARLRNRDSVAKLFAELGPRYKARPGGYTRVLRCGYRAGDSAPMAYIELVDRPRDVVAAEGTEAAGKGKAAVASAAEKAAPKKSRKKAAA